MNLPIEPRVNPHEWFEEKSLELFRRLKRPMSLRLEGSREIWVDTSEPALTPSSGRKPAAVPQHLYLPVVRPQAAAQAQRI